MNFLFVLFQLFSWQERVVLELAVFAGGWTLIVTADRSDLKSSVVSIYHARSGRSLSVSAVAACFIDADKEKETISALLLVRAEESKEAESMKCKFILLHVQLELNSPELFSATTAGSGSSLPYQAPFPAKQFIQYSQIVSSVELEIFRDNPNSHYFLLFVPKSVGVGAAILVTGRGGVILINLAHSDEKVSHKEDPEGDRDIQAVRLASDGRVLFLLTRKGEMFQIKLTDS